MVFMNRAPTAAMKVSEPDLQHQRQQERDGADADTEEEAADHADAEGRDLQEAELQDRIGRAPRVEDIEDQADCADHHAAGRDLRRDEVAPAGGEAQHEQREAEA
jgi:hypothetical protein